MGGARTCASCNVVSDRAWVLLMDAEALSVCGEELGELRHYGAGLQALLWRRLAACCSVCEADYVDFGL